jgi:hypothetical protein
MQFRDDGCSNSPDVWCGFDLRWCCRIHDWGYCLYRAMVRWKGHGSYDTCRGDAPKGATLAQLEIGHCRHGLRKNAAGGGSDASFKQPRPYAHTASGIMPGGAGQPK